MEDAQIELIDKYLLDNMEAEEKKAFEKRLGEDEELNKQVQIQRKLIEGMEKYQEKESFFSMLDEIKTEKPEGKVIDIKHPGKKNISIGSMRQFNRILAIAAGFAVLIVAAFFVFRNEPDYNAMAMNNFAIYPDEVTTYLDASGATDDANAALIPLLENGMNLLSQENFKEARIQFEQFRDRKVSSNYLSILNDFYLAQIDIQQNDSQTAIDLLTPLDNESGLPIAAAVKWYLALAYLQQGKIEPARTLLSDIIQDDEFNEPARNLLNELGN